MLLRHLVSDIWGGGDKAPCLKLNLTEPARNRFKPHLPLTHPAIDFGCRWFTKLVLVICITEMVTGFVSWKHWIRHRAPLQFFSPFYAETARGVELSFRIVDIMSSRTIHRMDLSTYLRRVNVYIILQRTYFYVILSDCNSWTCWVLFLKMCHLGWLIELKFWHMLLNFGRIPFRNSEWSRVCSILVNVIK